MIGFAFGSMLSGPFSETFGRNAVYISTLSIYLLFIMAAALAPNLGAHLAFRFLAGLFGSTPLTCSGGTIADLWDPLQKVYAFLIYAIPAFGGPVIGQLIGAFIPPTLGWRWLEWIMLIAGGAVLVAVVVLQPETYGDLLLYWKASALRQRTGDHRYRGPSVQGTDGDQGRHAGSAAGRCALPAVSLELHRGHHPSLLTLSYHHLHRPLHVPRRIQVRFWGNLWALARARGYNLGRNACRYGPHMRGSTNCVLLDEQRVQADIAHPT